MQAYAKAERPVPEELRTFTLSSPSLRRQTPASACSDEGVIDQLLGRLADLVVHRLIERTGVAAQVSADEWVDARAAAEYLGVHRDTLRKLAAQRAIPVHQDGPGCKLYFRRDELDDWRRSSKPAGIRVRAVV